MDIKLNEFAKAVHENAVAHGWWEEERRFGEIIALCHSELSEALEEHRDGRPMVYCDAHKLNAACDELRDCLGVDCLTGVPCRKPEGIAVELADCVIRILDYLGKEGEDVDALVAEALSFDDVAVPSDAVEVIVDCHALLSIAYVRGKADAGRPSGQHHARVRMAACIVEILGWAKKNDVDMEAVLDLKHEYNKGRPYRHGGKVL